MKWIALIEEKGVSTVHWAPTESAAHEWLVHWLRENTTRREGVRCTVAECIYTITG